MPRTTPTAVALAAILITATVMGAVAVQSASAQSDGDAITLPRHIGINSEDSVQAYNQSGVVRTSVVDPRMNITIATERDMVGLDLTANPLKSSTRNDFIRVTHREGLERTIRIPISAEYFHPFPRDGLESMDGSKTASLEPVTLAGEQYTMLTVSFDGRDSVVFPIPSDAVASYRAVERVENRTNSTFGINLGLTPSPWNYLPPDAFAGNNTTSVRVEGDPSSMMIQYNAGTPSSPEWLTVPWSQSPTSPVYVMEKEGVENAVYVVSTTSDAPQIRVKQKTTWGDKISSWVRGARNIPDRIGDILGVEIPEVNLF